MDPMALDTSFCGKLKSPSRGHRDIGSGSSDYGIVSGASITSANYTEVNSKLQVLSWERVF